MQDTKIDVVRRHLEELSSKVRHVTAARFRARALFHVSFLATQIVMSNQVDHFIEILKEKEQAHVRVSTRMSVCCVFVCVCVVCVCVWQRAARQSYVCRSCRCVWISLSFPTLTK